MTHCRCIYWHTETMSSDQLPKWPRVLVEISSQDYWDRHRVEGYGYLDIPRKSGQWQMKFCLLPSTFILICLFCFAVIGQHEVTVETWRPVGRPVIDQMNRFFIGGPPEIDDITYVATPREFQVRTYAGVQHSKLKKERRYVNPKTT